jgi:aerobic-type carbon monoxide dehydrogenase small subunit (CoxS/CutS family)
MSDKVTIKLKINGKKTKDQLSSGRTLADYLHETQNLTGTKVCCGMGICKACTVAIKRPGSQKLERVQACITPVSSLDGCEVTTVEGLAVRGEPNALQKAFLDNFSFQCGYSTPGFLMGATLLMDELRHKPVKRTELGQAIEASLGEHICRCSGYVRYYAAIKEVILASPGLTI